MMITKEERKEAKAQATKELHEWLLSLWNRMPKGTKKCKSCLGPIFGEFKPLYFDHLLEKDKYPQYSMTEDNIWFCCGDCHELKSRGFPKERHKQAIKKALESHLNG